MQRRNFSFLSTGARQCDREDSYLDPQGKRCGNVGQLIWETIRVTEQVARRQGHQLVLEWKQGAGANGLRFDLYYSQGSLRQVVHHRRTVSSQLYHLFRSVTYIKIHRIDSMRYSLHCHYLSSFFLPNEFYFPN